MTTPRYFVSAVTGELGTYRRDVARVLRRKKLEVRDQEHFRQGPATLLEALRDYIRECDAVFLLVGDRCGAFPSDEHATALGPIPIYEKYRAHSGQARASYTQWEYLLARHFGKKTYTYFTADGFIPDSANPESAEIQACQQAFRAWIEHLGEHRGSLTTAATLIEEVLVLPLPDLSGGKIVHLPYPSLGTLFKGRAEFMQQLRASLHRAAPGHAAAIVGKALHGLGGVGKTRLAVEYAWQHADDYDALLFITASTPADLRKSLADLAGALVLNLPEQDAREEDARVAAALRWLAGHPGWFLIVDNVDDDASASAVEDLLGKLHGGQVLITSRLSSWSGCVETLELDVLDKESAAQFLLERTQTRRKPRPGDAADARELARELDGLALALEQAGAYICEQRLSLAAYLRAWRSHLPEVQDWHDPRTMKYPRSVAVTWQTTLAQLGAGEVALLRLFAWFAPEPIPEFVLDGETAVKIWKGAAAIYRQESPNAADATRLRPALARLANYSMLRWNAAGSAWTVHRVVQEILRGRLPAATRNAWLTLSLLMLNNAAPVDPWDVRTWPHWDPLRLHVAAAVQFADAAGILDPASRLRGDLGNLFSAKALHADAEPLLRRDLELVERHRGPEHPDVAPRLNNLASLLHDMNRLAEAEPLMRRSLAIAERSYGPEHPDVATYLNNLAQLLQATNRLAEAEPLMRRSLAIAEKSYGPEHPVVAVALNNLASLLQATNRLAEAEPLMRRSLAIDEKSYGPEHPHVAIVLNNLALLLKATNRLAEAQPLMRRHVGIFLEYGRRTGHEHPHLHQALTNYVGILAALGHGADEVQQRLQALMAEHGMA